MGLKKKLLDFLKEYFCNSDWRCLVCGKEIFDTNKLCENCLSKMPFNDQNICEHCGRKVIAGEKYCSTCKGKLVYIDKGRSVFNYQKPINTLIKRLKYDNQRFIIDYFVEKLTLVYLMNYFNADFITFIPMTEKAYRKRGYNQSYILAKGLSEKVEVPLFGGVVKVKQTKRQATLSRDQRLKNLKDAFRITEKKIIKDKTVLIVDDVTTTGATGEAVAERLKKAGAKIVYLLTVASLPPMDKY